MQPRLRHAGGYHTEVWVRKANLWVGTGDLRVGAGDVWVGKGDLQVGAGDVWPWPRQRVDG